ncbi:hypothetical protein ACKKBF_B31700 [Auxenochlorella protothecoides x Auxenochlorella symbiontica]
MVHARESTDLGGGAPGLLRCPITDENGYRFVKLDNGLQVLLVHDPKTDKAAVACDVRVGSLSDPDDLPGLAHFLEHMLFYSSEKYPVEDEYSKFIAKHGGQTNAFTASESTNYHFDVNWDALAPALDRFAQFFICPLISRDGVDREAHAVDSEHGKNLNSDAWKALQLWKHTANPDHPFSRFATGNLETLLDGPARKNVEVHTRLKEFYVKHYCSQLMRAVIIGRESLDDLQVLASSAFGPVPCRGLRAPSFSPEATPRAGLLMKAVPERSGHTLELQWRVEPELKHYDAAPCQYFSHLLGDEGEGSLFALLKARGWATDLCAGESGTSFSAASIFMVRIGLTDAGQEHVPEVTSLVFSYLGMLRQPGGISHQVWEDARALAQLRFDFAEKMAPSSYATTLAGAMQVYGRHDLLLAIHHVPQRYDPELLDTVLGTLCPSEARVLWASSSFQVPTDCPLKEPWYGTAHSAGPLPAEWLAHWEAAWGGEGAALGGKDGHRFCGMHLPPPNPYIPSRFDLIKESSSSPAKIHATPLYTLWHRPETGFKVPKTAIYLHLRMPEAYLTPRAAVSTQLISRLLTDKLSEVAYPAELAGLHYGVRATTSGMLLSFWGHSHTLPRLVQTVLDSLLEFEVLPHRFELAKEHQAKDYANMRHEQPYQHGLYLLSVGLEARRWHVRDYEAVLPGVTVDSLRAFQSAMLGTVRIDALIAGNVPSADARALLQALEARLLAGRCSPPPASQRDEARVVALPSPMRAVHAVPGPNPANDNSAVVVAFQAGRDDVRRNALVDLVGHLGKREAFHTLRTVEQLGYITHLSAFWMLTVSNILVLIQSSAHSARYLQSRIDAFLPKLADSLRGMPAEEYAAHVEELAKAKLEKPKRLRDAINTDWSEIDDGTLRFPRKELEAAAVRSITQEELVAFFEDTVVNPRTRRSYSVLVEGNVKEPAPEAAGSEASEAPPTADEVLVSDQYSFKRGQALYASFL